jgi:hypothetical protein
MTRDQGNEVLTAWKIGLENFPPHIISQALRATGDLSPTNYSSTPMDDCGYRTIRVWHAPGGQS